MSIQFVRTTSVLTLALLSSALVVIAIMVLLTIPLTTVKTPYAADSFLTLETGDGLALWNRWQDSLSQDELLKLESITSTWTAQFFGEELSFSHHLLPLLQGKARVSLHQEEAGTAILVRVTGKKRFLQSSLEDLHRSTRDKLSPIKRTVHELDDQFSATDLRIDTDHIQSSAREHAGWTVHTVGSGEDPYFITAIQGNTALLSNSPTLLLETIDTPPKEYRIAIEPLSLPGDRIATLIYDPTILDSFLQNIAPFVSSPKPETKLMQIGSILLNNSQLKIETNSWDKP